MRVHLATLVQDFHKLGPQTAIVLHRGIRSRRTSYGELAELAGRFAAELVRRRILPGERVLLWGSNSPEWIAVFFGCLLRGVLVVPLDATGSTQLAARVLAEVSPRLVVADPALLSALPSGTPSLPLPDLEALLPAHPDLAVSDAVSLDAPFQIIFTSGTTADPKGIVHTHRNVLASLDPIEAEMRKYGMAQRLVRPLRFLHTLPLSHVFGQFVGLWIPALLAAELHLTDTVEPARMLYLIRRRRISVLVAVPRVLDLLRAHLLGIFQTLGAEVAQAGAAPITRRWWQFRSVHRAFGWKFWAIISGGAALAPDLERFWNTLGFALIQGYGMTETAALVTLNHPFHVGKGTIGKALPGREVRLSDSGEILVRGDVVSRATWQHGQLQQQSGEWLPTGDLAERNSSGELRFLGRSGDSIVTAAGLNIHPSDLETILARQTGLRQCVVVPCDLGNGPEPVAVVLLTGSDDTLQRAVQAANQQLATFQQLRRVLRWPTLAFPYTSTGKLLRREIAAWACSTLRDQQDSAGEPSAGDWLLSLIAGITADPLPPGDDTRRLSEDLHLDSLGRVQLASALDQQTGLPLDEQRLASLETLGDLRQLVQSAASAVRGEVAAIARTPGPVPQAAPQPTLSVPGRPSGVPLSTRNSPNPHADSLPYPRWPWTWPVRALRSVFLRWIARPLVALLAAPRVVPSAHPLPPGPCLIIANHVTAFDAALVLAALPWRQSRRVAIAMSGEILSDFRHARGQRSGLRDILAPLAYWLITALFNVFPLPRLRGFQRSFQHAGEALDQGYSVLVFPEGSRSRSGALQHFRPGIGLLAQAAQVPVLPVALLGLDRARHAGWLRSGLLEIRVGSPIPYTTASAAEWTEHLEAALRSLGAWPLPPSRTLARK